MTAVLGLGPSMHVLNHADKHLSVRGPLTVRRSPQGRPILVQAGVSEPGQQIAAEYCDMVFMATERGRPRRTSERLPARGPDYATFAKRLMSADQ